MTKRSAGYEIKPSREGDASDEERDDSISQVIGTGISWKANQAELSKREISVPKSRMKNVPQTTNPFAKLNVLSDSNPKKSIPIQKNESFSLDHEKDQIQLKKHGLNNSFLQYLNEQFTKNPCVDFSGSFEKYKSHLNSIISVQADMPMEISPHKSTISQNIEPLLGSIDTKKAPFVFNQPTVSIKTEQNAKSPFSFPHTNTLQQSSTSQDMQEKSKDSFSLLPEKNVSKPDVTFCFPTGQANIDKPHLSSPAKPEFAFTFNQQQTSLTNQNSNASPFKFASPENSSLFSLPVQSSAENKNSDNENDEDNAENQAEDAFDFPDSAEDSNKKILSENRCKVFLFKDKEYIDKGVCLLRIVENEDGKKCIIARMRGTGMLVLNSVLSTGCKVTQASGKRDILLLCSDLSGRLTRFLVRFKTITEAAETKDKINAILMK